MTDIKIRRAVADDAKLLTDLAYTTFWDAFAHHPKNAPDDLAYYMRQAFRVEQITEELADPKSLFLIAEIDGEAAGYAKLIFDTTEPTLSPNGRSSFHVYIHIRNISARASARH